MAGDSSRVILVTGCSSGIGRALALEFASRGHRVFATARRVESMTDLASRGIEALPLDVTKPDTIARAVEDVIARAGRVDMLVNNAGQNLIGPLAEVPLGTVTRMFDTNVTGLLAVTQAVFPHMVRAGAGRIVNVGSVVGLLPTPFAGAYCATKAAVHMLSEVLRLEVAPFGIDVVVVQPGGVRSKISETGSADIARYGEATSHYRAAKRGIDKRATASQDRSVDATDFARTVADQVLKRKAPRVVRAGWGARAYPALSRLPHAVREPILSRVFGLERLKGER